MILIIKEKETYSKNIGLEYLFKYFEERKSNKI